MKIRNGNFSRGIIKDVDPVEIPNDVFEDIINTDIRNKKAKKLPGTADFITDIPSDQDLKYVEIFKLTGSYDQEITLMHTIDQSNSRDKLWVKPYIDSSGSFTNEWQDLTEVEESLTLTTVAGTGASTIDGLSSSVDDYYNDWIIVNTTRKTVDEVIDYIGSTKTVSYKFGAMTGQTIGDSIYIMRNPVFMNLGGSEHVYALDVEDDIYFLQSRDNSIQIFTGGDKTYREKTDFKLFANKEKTDRFGESTFDEINRFYLVSKQCDPIFTSSATALALISTPSGDVDIHDPDPNWGFSVAITAIYDGYQETPIYPLWKDELPSKGWFEGIVYTANRVIEVTISIPTLWAPNVPEYLLFSPYTEGSYSATSSPHLVMPKRITGFNVYLAETSNPLSERGIASAWRLVKNISVDDHPNWVWEPGGRIGTAETTINIDENDWVAGEITDFGTRLGHDAMAVYANCDQAVVSGNKVFMSGIANFTLIGSDDEDLFDDVSIYFAPVDSSDNNTPDIVPFVGSSISVRDYSMNSIIGLVANDTNVVAFTDKGVLNINSTSLSAKVRYDDNTLLNKNAVVEANGIMYFATRNDLMIYYPQFNTIKSLASGRIREAWKDIDKDATSIAVGYDNKLDVVVFSAGSDNFIFNVPISPADTFTADTQAFGAFHQYDVAKQFTRFFTNTDGQLLGITNDNLMHGLFDTTSTESLAMTQRTSAIEGPVHLRELTLYHKGSDDITVNIYDLDISAIVPCETIVFTPYSINREEKQRPSIQVGTLQLEFVSSASVNTDNEIVYYEIDFTTNKKRME